MWVPRGSHTIGFVRGHDEGRRPLEGTCGWYGRDVAELIPDDVT